MKGEQVYPKPEECYNFDMAGKLPHTPKIAWFVGQRVRRLTSLKFFRLTAAASIVILVAIIGYVSTMPPSWQEPSYPFRIPVSLGLNSNSSGQSTISLVIPWKILPKELATATDIDIIARIKNGEISPPPPLSLSLSLMNPKPVKIYC